MLPCDWCDGWDVTRRVRNRLRRVTRSVPYAGQRAPAARSPCAAASSSRACASAVSDSSWPGQHPGQLPQPAGLVEHHHPAAGDRAVVGLRDHQVLVGERGHLRQVGDDDHLGAAGQRGQPAPDLDRRLAADAGVDLVEHQRRHRVGAREHHLDREHHPGQLTAGRALRSGRAGAPGCGRSSSSTSSTPCGPKASVRPSTASPSMSAVVLGDGDLDGARWPSRARPARRSPRRRTARRPPTRAAESWPAGPGELARPARPARRSAAPIRSSSPSSSVSRAAARCAQASTAATSSSPSTSSPYLRISRVSAARRSCTDAEPGRVGVDRRGVGREVGRHVGQQVADLAQPVDQRRPAPGRATPTCSSAGRAAATSAVASPALVVGGLGDARAARRGPARRGPQRRRRARAAPPRPQRGVLARLRVDRLDLVEAEAQQVGLLGPLAGRAWSARPARCATAAQLVVRRAVAPSSGTATAVAGVPVQRLALPGRLQQPLLVGLAVHRHAGRRPARRARPPAPPRRRGCARDRPSADTVRADQQHVVVELGAGLGARRAPRRRPARPASRPSTDARVGAGPHRRRGRPGRRAAARGRSPPWSCRRRSRRSRR